MRTFSLFLIILLLFDVSASLSTIYKWTDKDGNLHFSDTPPPASVNEEATSPVKEFLSTGQYILTVFKIIKADDPGIIGTYIPIQRTYPGFPQYELKTDRATDHRKHLPRILVKNQKGKWKWQIKTDYSNYSSTAVKEGVPADKVWEWRKRYDNVQIVIRQVQIESDRNLYKYNYRYDLNIHSSGLPEWQKQTFRVTGAETEVNGEYFPVNWSAETPRYRTSGNACLAARTLGSSWQWNLGNCMSLQYSSSREPAETMPHQVQQWVKNKGLHVVPIKVKKLTP